jgi:ribose 5-phosphate isomerase A
MSAEHMKQAAAFAAVDRFVKSGMKLGLGTGSTTKFAIDRVGQKLKDGSLRDLVAVSTSERSSEQARALGIPLSTLGDTPALDVAIDGADEVVQRPKSFELTKGLGGALLREKDVARHAKTFVVIVDETKLVAKLGTKAPTPVEIRKGDEARLAQALAQLGGRPALRGPEGAPYVTDNGNHILDVSWPNGIDDAHALAAKLDALEGVRAHGLFLDLARFVVVASDAGVKTLTT